MNTPTNPFCVRIAASRVGSGHRFAVSHRLRRYEPSPQLCCRSFLAYLLDMGLRHNLKVSLRRNSLCSFSRHSLMKQLAIRLSQQAGKSLVMRGSLRLIPQNGLVGVFI